MLVHFHVFFNSNSGIIMNQCCIIVTFQFKRFVKET